MAKISIIIPIYNTEKFLDECIESVINQTFKDIEIILVNDGSLGNADSVCKKYELTDSRIKYFSKKNEGAAVARNFGISKATGDYIFCIDSDDTVNKNFLQEIYDAFIQYDCDFLAIGTLLNDNLSKLGCLPTWGFAVKKEMLDKYTDVRFQVGIHPCEDGIFSHKLLALTDKTAKLSSDGYNYRNNPDSCENNINVNKILKEIPKWFDYLTEFYDKYNLWSTHKIHLLYFIQNEPFGRLNKLNLNLKQKIYLSRIIQNFIKKNNLLENTDITEFSPDFQIFLKQIQYTGIYCFDVILFFIQKTFSVNTAALDKYKRIYIRIFGIKIKFKIKITD